MEFLGIGIPELLVIIVLTLIVVGPERLPEVMAQGARLLRDFRQYTAGLQSEVTTVLEEIQEEFRDVEDATSATARLLNEQLSVTEERTEAGVDQAAPLDPTGESRITDEAVPGSPSEGAAVEASPSRPVPGVASLEELRRRVLRGSNGAGFTQTEPFTLPQADQQETKTQAPFQEA